MIEKTPAPKKESEAEMGRVKSGAYVRINMNYPRLMPTEKKIADIIMKNIESIDTLSIQDIAEEAGASKATVTRFCKRLGYNGFKDFRVSAIKDTHTGMDKVDRLLEEETSGTEESLIERICASNSRACLDTVLLLDSEQLSMAADLLLSKRRVIFVGEGAVAAVLLDLYQKLLRLGLLVVYSQDVRMQRMQVSVAGPDDVVLVVDFSGSKHSCVEMARQASENGAAVITLCNAIGPELARWGSANLFGPGRMGSSVSASLAPRISLLCIVDCLFTLLEKKMGQQAATAIRKTNEVIVGDWV